jgi:tetratricopeptide (TPR) repeat protein
VEERVVVSTIRGIVGGGVPQLAVGWISERIEAQPDRAFYYRLQFQIFQAMGDFDQAKNTADTWERRSGEKDPDMERGLAEMRQRSLDREQGRIDEALEKAQEPGEADGQ